VTRWNKPSSLVLCAVLCAGGFACGKAKEPGPKRDGSAAATAEDRRPAAIVEALRLSPGAHVADIGAGPGALSLHLARAVAPNGRVVATDIDSGSLNHLATRIADAGFEEIVEPRLVQGDTPELEDNAFDLILVADVDNAFRDREAWLRAASRALRAGGRIAISNKHEHKTAALAAARAAGLTLVSATDPVESRFLAIFERR
jgi:ubiquinone/menaquinone biosynthesis C-methylase UbiE